MQTLPTLTIKIRNLEESRDRTDGAIALGQREGRKKKGAIGYLPLPFVCHYVLKLFNFTLCLFRGFFAINKMEDGLKVLMSQRNHPHSPSPKPSAPCHPVSFPP